MQGSWDTYAICPGCDAKYRLPHGNIFFLFFSVCPSCGERKPEHSWSPLGKWQITVLRWVPTGRLFHPSTWGSGHWETRGESHDH